MLYVTYCLVLPLYFENMGCTGGGGEEQGAHTALACGGHKGKTGRGLGSRHTHTAHAIQPGFRMLRYMGSGWKGDTHTMPAQ